MINIKEENGKISYTESEEHNEKTLIQKYKNEWTGLQVVEHQLKRIPEAIKQTEAEIELIKFWVEKNDKTIETLKEIFEQAEINISKRISKIKAKYTEEELIEKTKDIHLKSKTEIKKVDDKYERVITYLNDTEELLIYYTSLQFDRINYLEKLAQSQKTIERLKENEKKQTNTVNQIKENLKATEDFFKKQGKNLDKLMAETKTEAQEISLK